jgi:hypothetical protein
MPVRVVVNCGKTPSDKDVSTRCRVAFCVAGSGEGCTALGASGTVGITSELLELAGSSTCGVCAIALWFNPAETSPSTMTEQKIGTTLLRFNAISYGLRISRLCLGKICDTSPQCMALLRLVECNSDGLTMHS